MTNTNPYELPPEPRPLNDSGLFQPNNEERNLALLAHLSGIIGIVMGGLIGFLGPLVIYLMKKDSSAYVESQAKEALNFQITLLLVTIGCIAAVFLSCGSLFPLAFAPVILQVVFAIVAALAVRDGQPYQYPFNLRLLK